MKILLQGQQEATDTIIKKVEKALNADDVRPLTDKVIVSQPEVVNFSVDVTFYIPKSDSASAVIIEAAVRESVESYIRWQTEKMGRDINPSYLVRLMMEAGAKRVEVREPVFTAIDNIKVARLENKTILNGGLEDA